MGARGGGRAGFTGHFTGSILALAVDCVWDGALAQPIAGAEVRVGHCGGTAWESVGLCVGRASILIELLGRDFTNAAFLLRRERLAVALRRVRARGNLGTVGGDHERSEHWRAGRV